LSPQQRWPGSQVHLRQMLHAIPQADANFQKGNLSPSTGQSQQHWLFGDQAGSTLSTVRRGD
jgi:hypothetical protein